jgi:hypothetical protein
VTDADLVAPPAVDIAPRPLGAPELLESVESGREVMEPIATGRESAELGRALPSVEELVGSLERPTPHLRKAQ